MLKQYGTRTLTLLLVVFTIIVTLHTFFKSKSTKTKPILPYTGSYVSADDEITHGFLPATNGQEFCSRRRLPLYQARNRRRKIYDLFLINTELDWLDLRLQELASQVDHFIILEATQTFQETPKPLHFHNAWARFANYTDKITRYTLNMTDANLHIGDAWEHERYTRNALVTHALLSNPAIAPTQGDVLLVSDIDEIPRPETLTTLRNCAFPPRVTLRSAFYYYSFQWRHRGEQWPHPQATFFNGRDTVYPEDLRKGQPDFELFNAAWHCSTCLPSLADVQNKIASFAHKGYNHAYYLDRRRLLRVVRAGIDLFERKEEVYDRVENNSDVPAALLTDEGRSKYLYMLDRDPPNANFLDSNGNE